MISGPILGGIRSAAPYEPKPLYLRRPNRSYGAVVRASIPANLTNKEALFAAVVFPARLQEQTDWLFDPSEPWHTLALHHGDVDATDIALGADLHGLLVAVGPQGQVGGKSRSLDEHLDLAAARGALQVAENIPARLAPVAGNPVALAGDIAGEVEFVAVAGAAETLLQIAALDLVVGLA